MKSKIISKNFRKTLENYLTENNITKSEFAKLSNISAPTIGKIISGKQKYTRPEYYNAIKNIIKSTNLKDNTNNITDVDIIDFANYIKKKYDITPTDMTRIFETSKENIDNLLRGRSVSVALFMKLSYYYDKEIELVDLCREKRYTVSSKDKIIIDNKVKDLYNEGYDYKQLSLFLHTSIGKVRSIVDGTDDYLGYPANVYGRKAFNDIINGMFKIENCNIESNYESNNIEKDQLVYHYQYGSEETEEVEENNFDDTNYEDQELTEIEDDIETDEEDTIEEEKEVQIELLEDQDNIKTITLDGQKYICFLANSDKILSDNNIKKLSQIIDIMTTIDEDKIKISCDIDI